MNELNLLKIKKQQDEYRKRFGNCYQKSGYVFEGLADERKVKTA